MQDLVAGPRLTYGDIIGLNVSEKLNTATRIHQGNVVTNLKRIVSCLPNDLIIKWQNKTMRLLRAEGPLG